MPDPEVLHDEVDGYVTSLLGMLGLDADPLSSREHILLANLIETAWSQGRDLDLGTLLAQVQQPPMRKLGVLELDQFFPAADRAAFALRLNGLLAAPSFGAWLSGDPIDIDAMLRTPDGRPRCAIVTTAHLSDEERQSVTALVLAKLVTWMRRQSGTTDLRALLYMDEVAGYLPPTANPPTKRPIMLLLKQARAFGVGVVLSTQNPVDVDYKALSNAGTWMVGRLQTERDKARLVDGLASAAGTVDVGLAGDTISGLGKREFLLRRAGVDAPEVFTTRWAMSYLRGPLTRDQIASLRTPAPAPPAATAPPVAVGTGVVPPVVPGDDETPVMPAVADGTLVAWLDPAAAWAPVVGATTGSHLRAAAVARVHLRYDEVKADLVHDEEYEAVLFPLPQLPDPAGFVPVDYDERDLLAQPPPSAVYGLAVADLDSKTWWATLRRALADHLVRTRTIEVLLNRELRLYSRVGETREQFAARCLAVADAKADEATAALRDKYDSRLAALRTRLQGAEAAVREKEAAKSAAYQDTAMTAVNSMLGGLFGGRRSRASVSTAARKVKTAGARVDTARERADTLAAGVADLEEELAAEVADLEAEWLGKATAVEVVPIPLERSDVSVVDLRLVWVPVR
ncbi:MAG: ATP-binding protein [Actinomycetia bacterium]|nr:ATP-binding protein [Actinomycetes bacterium]